MKLEIQLTKEEMKMIVEDYTLCDGDEFKYDDEQLKMLQAINNLDRVDFIIWCLYTHFGSERKTAKVLGVSRTPVHNRIQKIREKIINNL